MKKATDKVAFTKPAKHAHKGGRCSYDEYHFDREMREEEEIKSEVIAEFRGMNRALLANQERILTALIATQDLLSQSLDALRVYREEILSRTRASIAALDDGRCVPNCKMHEWHIDGGWKRKPIRA